MNVGRVLPNLSSSKWIVILFAWALCVWLLLNILVGFHANLNWALGWIYSKRLSLSGV
jgi:hypothetical protein